ncbi:unnamed protein product, partial [Owenia fusiformis]
EVKNMEKYFPHLSNGKVVTGFGRGSKQLGIPTANFPEEVVDELPPSLPTGVYFGWASVDGGPIYKMVMSVGWNPFYNNEKKSMETHILHTFEEDFYGSELKVVMVGYIRPEKNFKSLDDLISAIKSDIDTAHEQLEKPEYQIYKDNEFFKPTLQNGHVNGLVNGTER